eukprot:TRINITY_DN7240_c0_g1_i1.p3 TRINITY_DN7240_c0_g1~~TRINITY_DN7240_c0_g1_i1.p3  ORF type:complete len:199 (-),score=12.34 TRINITY_DN7240_c0_g1_i1:132-728(-)
MIQGVINFLISDETEAQELRSRFIFKIVPMLNPDGVIIGNYRTGFGGRDLNRQYNGNSQLFPTVSGIKSLVNDCKKKNDVLAYIDFHGHSIKPNVFMYGPEYSNDNPKQYETKFIPKIINTISDMFSYESSIFTIASSKKNTSRGVFFLKISLLIIVIQLKLPLDFIEIKKQKFSSLMLRNINQWVNKFFKEYLSTQK